MSEKKMNPKQQMFHEAVSGEFDKAKELFYENKFAANITERWGGSSLLSYAVSANDLDFVADLIKNGADVNARGEGMTVLHHANSAAAVKLLADAGAKLDAVSSVDGANAVKGSTALHFAVLRENREVLQALVEAGANANLKDKEGFRAIDLAIDRDAGMTADLIEGGAVIDGTEGKGLRALIAERFDGFPFPEPKIREQHKAADAAAPKMTPKQQMFQAVIMGEFDKAKELFYEHNFSADITERKGGTSILAYAVKAQDLDFAADLIKRGADVNARGEGMTVLHHADNAAAVKLLADAGAKLDAASSVDGINEVKGSTALHFAVLRGSREVVQALIEAGANPNLKDKEGFRAIDLAAHRDAGMTADLIEGGAIIDGKEGKGLREAIAERFPLFKFPAQKEQQRQHPSALPELKSEALAGLTSATQAAKGQDAGQAASQGEAKQAVPEAKQQEQAELDLSQKLPDAAESNTVEAGEATQSKTKTIDEEVRARTAAMWLSRSRTDIDGERHDERKPMDNQLESEGRTVGDSEMPIREADDKQANPAAKSIPEKLEPVYLKVGDKYHYQSRPDVEAFQDKGLKLETRSNSDKIAMDMVLIASHRGWSDLRVRGSEEFRRQVWLEGSARGMEVFGYKPKEVDLVLLEKRKAELPQNVIEAGRETAKKQEAQAQAQQQAPASASKSSEQAAVQPKQGQEQQAAANAPAAPAPAPAPAAQESTKQSEQERQAQTVAEAKAAAKMGIFAGELLEHGSANFNFDKEEKGSYYVKFRDIEGKERMQWGKDLQRAMSESGAKIGEKITLTKTDREPVTVDQNVRDEHGKVVGTEMAGALRNRWDVKVEGREQSQQSGEWKEKANSLRTQPPEQAAKDHPDMIGAAAAVKLAEKASEQMFPNASKEDRAKFVGYFRQNLAQIVEDRQVAPKLYVNEKQPVQQKAATATKGQDKKTDLGEQEMSR